MKNTLVELARRDYRRRIGEARSVFGTEEAPYKEYNRRVKVKALKAYRVSIRQIIRQHPDRREVGANMGAVRRLRHWLSPLRRLLIQFSSCDIYENTLSIPSLPCKANWLKLQVITSADQLGGLQGNSLNMQRPAECKDALNRGVVLFVAFAGNKPVYRSAVWIGQEAHNSVPWMFNLPCGYAVNVGGDFTAVEYRRLGIHSYVQSQVFQYLKEHGVSRAMSHQAKDNVAAHNAAIKLGSYLWGEIYYLTLLNLIHIRWRRCRLPNATWNMRYVVKIGRWR